MEVQLNGGSIAVKVDFARNHYEKVSFQNNCGCDDTMESPFEYCENNNWLFILILLPS